MSCPTGDGATPDQVANRAVGVFRNFLQVGTLVGDVHLHPPRRLITAVVAVWLPALIMVLSLISADSTRQTQFQPQPSGQSSAPPTTRPAEPTANAGAVPPVQQDQTRTVQMEVPGDAATALDGLNIAIETVGFTNTHNGEVDCGGGGNGPGSGGCVGIGGGTRGISTLGVIDFSVITPALICTVSSVHVNESVVITESPRRWTRIIVLKIGPSNPNAQGLPVVLEVSRGHGEPAPQSPKICVPG